MRDHRAGRRQYRLRASEPGFLETLRKLTRKFGIVLIFDEVMTGFRVSFGGAQAYYGIKPDMTCLGKVIGGGLPVGAYGGKKEIMSMVSPEGPCIRQAHSLVTSCHDRGMRP